MLPQLVFNGWHKASVRISGNFPFLAFCCSRPSGCLPCWVRTSYLSSWNRGEPWYRTYNQETLGKSLTSLSLSALTYKMGGINLACLKMLIKLREPCKLLKAYKTLASVIIIQLPIDPCVHHPTWQEVCSSKGTWQPGAHTLSSFWTMPWVPRSPKSCLNELKLAARAWAYSFLGPDP